MPPRVSPHRLQQYTCCQCLRSQRQTSRESNQPPLTSQFHTTAPNATRLRRNMWAWLNGPGKVFRDPLPGSTNYLAAYDKRGNLLRASKSEGGSSRNGLPDAELNESEEEIQRHELADGVPEEEIAIRAEQRAERRAGNQDADARAGIPKETMRDLRPYPLNHYFRSQSVLSEELRQKVYELIIEQGLDLKAVSAAFGVDVRRVAAVVRLKSLEKEWIRDGKQLAKPYNDAVLSMLPQTPYRPDKPMIHESINDLPVHSYTRQQMFVSASESRAFTRADAAKAFHDTLLPADERIAHPELIQITKWEIEGHDQETRQRMIREKDAEQAEKRERKERKQREWEERTQVVVPGRRWNFKFQDISAEKVGKDGRGRDAVGLRYGMAHEDRKKGQIKIPTKVE